MHMMINNEDKIYLEFTKDMLISTAGIKYGNINFFIIINMGVYAAINFLYGFRLLFALYLCQKYRHKHIYCLVIYFVSSLYIKYKINCTMNNKVMMSFK